MAANGCFAKNARKTIKTNTFKWVVDTAAIVAIRVGYAFVTLGASVSYVASTDSRF